MVSYKQRSLQIRSVQFIQLAVWRNLEGLRHVSNCPVHLLADQAGYFNRFVMLAKTRMSATSRLKRSHLLIYTKYIGT